MDQSAQNDKKARLKRAEEIRRFEINLYWRRTTYYWTLIAAAFVAFFAILSANGLDRSVKLLIAFVVANVGFVFSIGWYFINRGSKFWQQNWETQVDILEKNLGENLYRSVYGRVYENEKCCSGACPDRSTPYSVSKINEFTSVYVTIIWVFLGVVSFAQWYTCKDCDFIFGGFWNYVVVLIVSLIFWMKFYCKARTKLESSYKVWHLVCGRTPEICKHPKARP